MAVVAKPENVRFDGATVTVAAWPAATQFFQVPTTIQSRAIFFATLADTSGGANQITIRIYDDDGVTVDHQIIIPIALLDTIVVGQPIDSPWLVVPAGKFLRAQATVNNVEVYLAYYDIGL
ncbi:MAG: hypothetical protein PHU95_03530 [Candidatus Thermoplasmatota archaeon]|nr:hypothetical protein [Candidatus Thermoplasmatota archaeon]MDD5778499.1 hypothetical protein [Candidatus Thermoplasmatota archaeon]